MSQDHSAEPVLGPAGIDVCTNQDLFAIIAAYLREEEEQWYQSIIPYFPKLRLFSTYKPFPLRLSKHAEVRKLAQLLQKWEMLLRQREFHSKTFQKYRNMKVLELPIPPSIPRCHQLANVLHFAQLEQLNIQTGFDDWFMEKAQILVLGCPTLRVLRIKHITYEADIAIRPWQHPAWFSLMAVLFTIEVFYLNTPLLLTRKQELKRVIRPWVQPMRRVKRVYLQFGYDEEIDPPMGCFLRSGVFFVLTREGGRWKERPIQCRNPFARDPPSPRYYGIMPEDEDPFGPDDDQPNGSTDPRSDKKKKKKGDGEEDSAEDDSESEDDSEGDNDIEDGRCEGSKDGEADGEEDEEAEDNRC
ncbi:hypothetical protein BDN72DRAFT_893606 [Pluteus cervinus]|uniref:Uncharacterized protein n=1 Tax=Pluteus cervinus TaxID=181527 RepID=A0ACD3B7B0_9AGAR|nr:hypothetical protein BDN72DRAFT_893606 [Pluteus cervinus]